MKEEEEDDLSKYMCKSHLCGMTPLTAEEAKRDHGSASHAGYCAFHAAERRFKRQ